MRSTKMVAGARAGGGHVEEVHRRFERWRSTRKRCAPIPEALWAAAVGIARAYGLNRTARRLRLNYYALKERLDAAAGPGCESRAQARFVELISPSAAGGCECVLELENARGAKMRIQLKGSDTVDLASLSGVFWNLAR